MSGICGRPTRTGTCRRALLWYETACTYHATPTELDQATSRLRGAIRHQLADECGCAGVTHCPRCDP